MMEKPESRIGRVDLDIWLDNSDHAEATLTHDGGSIYLRVSDHIVAGDGRVEIWIDPVGAIALGEALARMGRSLE